MCFNLFCIVFIIWDLDYNYDFLFNDRILYREKNNYFNKEIKGDKREMREVGREKRMIGIEF